MVIIINFVYIYNDKYVFLSHSMRLFYLNLYKSIFHVEYSYVKVYSPIYHTL